MNCSCCMKAVVVGKDYGNCSAGECSNLGSYRCIPAWHLPWKCRCKVGQVCSQRVGTLSVTAQAGLLYGSVFLYCRSGLYGHSLLVVHGMSPFMFCSEWPLFSWDCCCLAFFCELVKSSAVWLSSVCSAQCVRARWERWSCPHKCLNGGSRSN